MHPFHSHREYQASHRRVGTRLKDQPDGAMKHATGKAFSNVTSKTAAASHDSKVEGKSAPKRFARGGKVKHSDEAQDRKLITKMMAEHERKEGEKGYARGGKVKGATTNIAIVLPGGDKGDMAEKMAMAAPPMPMPPPGMPPGGPPPGMPMRASGGRVKRADGGRLSDKAAAPMPTLPDKSGDKMTADTSSNLPDFMKGKTFKARGGSVIDGESTKADISKWSKRASDNSYFRGGAATGVGRQEKAAHMKRKGK